MGFQWFSYRTNKQTNKHIWKTRSLMACRAPGSTQFYPTKDPQQLHPNRPLSRSARLSKTTFSMQGYNACLSVYEHCCFWKDALVLYRRGRLVVLDITGLERVFYSSTSSTARA